MFRVPVSQGVFGVVGGLIPVVSYEKYGLADNLFNLQSFKSCLNIVYKVCSFKNHTGENDTPTNFIRVINLQNNTDISINTSEIHLIAASFNNGAIYASAKRIDKDGHNLYGVKIFKDKDSLYFKTTKIGGHIYFIGSNIKVTAVESLPEDAEEVDVF